MKAGVLYGVGIGPGDPMLVTRRAWQLISDACTIAYLAPDNGDSFARAIVADAIATDADEVVLRVPMRPGRAPAQSIYDDGATRISERLQAGFDVVMLCEGDPLFYGSFMYMLARLKHVFSVVVVPGVTSMTACAAAHLHPLLARNDIMTILPAPLDDTTLRDAILAAEAVAIMKLGRHMPRVRALLNEMGLAGSTVYVSHASLDTELSCLLDEAPHDAPYFSMLLIYKGQDPWITR